MKDKSTGISSPHDTCFRKLMQQPGDTLSFFRYYLVPEWQQQVDLNTLTLDSGSTITTEFTKLHSDILYRAALRAPAAQGQTGICTGFVAMFQLRCPCTAYLTGHTATDRCAATT